MRFLDGSSPMLMRRRRGGPSSLLTGLVSYWKLDEASGQRNDSHGANHLTDNNTVGQAAGKVGNAAQFVANNLESLSVPSNADVLTGDIDFTVAGWVYFDNLAGQYPLASKYDTNNQREWIIFLLNPRIQFWASANGVNLTQLAANSFGAPSTATWYFVAAWHDATANTISIQVNNGTVDSLAHAAGVHLGTAAFRVGAFSFGNTVFNTTVLNGRVDEVGFWKRLLTANERTSLYNSGNGRTYPF